MKIRVMTRPRGEAPEEIREAWIGLSFQVLPRYSRLEERREVGVLSGPRSWLATMLIQSLPFGARMRGYVVDAASAIDILDHVNPKAAAWWRTNAPHVLSPGRCLMFDKECCVVVEE